MLLRQVVQHIDRQLAQALALAGRPFVEGGSTPYIEAFEEIALVESHGGLKTLDRGRRRRLSAEVALKSVDVDEGWPVVAERNRFAGDNKMLAYQLAQVGEHLAQAVRGGGVSVITPKQGSEGLARVRTPRNREIDEERRSLR